jgi:integrase
VADRSGRRKRAGNNQGSIYRRASDGRWVGSVSLGMIDGKRQRKTVYGSTQTEVRRKLTEIQGKMDRGIPVRSSSPTVATFLDDWLVGVEKQGRRPKTVENYRQVIENHLKPALGRHRLEKLTQHHVQLMLDDMMERGLELSSIGFYRNVLRAALMRAMKLDLVARNVATLVDLPAPKKLTRSTLSAEGASRLLETVRGDRLEALYVVAITLGLRQGETLGLQWRDVDLDEGILTVRQQLVTVGGVTMFGPPKSANGERVIPLPTSVVEVLKQHRRRQIEERLAAGGRWQDQWQLVFCTQKGAPLSGSVLRKHFHESLNRAGLPVMRWHDLRHSTASILAAWDVHPKVVQAILGHGDASLTIQRYTHADLQAVRAAADRMGSLFDAEKGAS